MMEHYTEFGILTSQSIEIRSWVLHCSFYCFLVTRRLLSEVLPPGSLRNLAS